MVKVDISMLPLSRCLAAAVVLAAELVPASDALTLAVLSNHSPSAWDNCTTSPTDCNLRVYESAITSAAANGASVVLLPEAYGLSPSMDEIEPWVSDVGMNPCDSAEADAPAQRRVSCAAKNSGVTVISNFFVSLPNGTNLINDAVFDSMGAAVAAYSKHHLFPTEKFKFTEGPYNPTSVNLPDGIVLGLLICYEGAWPVLSGDWSQMEDLVAAGSTHLAWSIGGVVPLPVYAPFLAKKFTVGVVAAEDGKAAAVVGATGESLNTSDIPISVDGYTASASISLGTL